MKFKKLTILLTLLLSFSLCGCELNYYLPETNQNKNETTSTYSDDPNFIKDSSYNGTITYGDSSLAKLSPEQVYRNGVTSTVYVIARNLETASLGSGVFFSEDVNDNGYAYLFTNAHVVKDAQSIEIIYSNYKRDSATIVGYHVLEDIAVLAVKKNNNYTIARIQTSDKLSIGSEVLTIGTPISTDYSFSATNGIISKIDSPINSTIDETYSLLLLQIDASLNPGSSGGPLFDMYGNLIGLNTMKVIYDINFNNVDDLNFAIPMERAVFIADKIFSKTPYYRGYIGIEVIDIIDLSLSNRSKENITLNYGLYIINIPDNSHSKSKLMTKDVITKINGISFTNKIKFQKELYKYSKGETITLTIFKNNTYTDINITLQ